MGREGDTCGERREEGGEGREERGEKRIKSKSSSGNEPMHVRLIHKGRRGEGKRRGRRRDGGEGRRREGKRGEGKGGEERRGEERRGEGKGKGAVPLSLLHDLIHMSSQSLSSRIGKKRSMAESALATL